MKIAAILNAHDNTELVIDTIESIQSFVTTDILVVADGGTWEEWGSKVELPAQKVQGFVHKYPKAPYRNLTFGLFEASKRFDADWYLYCFRGNTIIETIDGAKKISEIKKDELVKTHLGRFRKVKHVFSRVLQQRSPLLWINTKHNTIKCTPEHPFFISRNNNLGVFIKACEIKEGDMLLYPNEKQEDNIEFNIKFNSIGKNGSGRCGIKNGQEIKTIPVNNDIARFFGLYLAEGHADRDGIAFTFNNNEKEYIEFITKMADNLFNRKPNIRTTWATQLRINVRSSSKLFISWFVKKANQKTIPSFVFNWSTKNKLQFIKGYLEGDGHFTKKGKTWTFRTASKKLVNDMINLTKSCGLIVTYCKQKPCISTYKGKQIKGGISYQCCFSKKSSNKMLDLLESTWNGGYLRIPVSSITNKKMPAISKEQRTVYNIEVDEDNSYIADCAAVHNCEPDVLYTSSGFQTELYGAEKNNIWCIGNDVRNYQIKLPYLEKILNSPIKEYKYLLGCCVFMHKKLINILKQIRFFEALLSATNGFEKGHFPNCDEQNIYDFGEILYPTLASHFGGGVAQFAVWNQFLEQWNGNFKKYPMRWRPSIKFDEIYPETSIIHPSKIDEVRTYYRMKRQKGKYHAF